MADRLPSLPLFVDDYEGATTHLTLEEDGAYMRLLRLCWRTPRCTIPDEPEWIMRRLRVDRGTFDRIVAPLIDEFFKRSRGRIYQKRLLQEFAYAVDRQTKRKEAGKKGGRAKAQKINENDASKATVLPEQKPSNALAPSPAQPNVYTLPDGNAASAENQDGELPIPADPEKQFWDEAKTYLGKSKASLIGKWVAEFGRDAVSRAILTSKAEGNGAGAVDPPSFIVACLRNGQQRADDRQREEDAARASFEARFPPQCLPEHEWRALMGDEEFERKRHKLLIADAEPRKVAAR